ncbi:MAG: hypothetical protein FJX72_07165 [Armatimonadetes bacterium]|nr:hypothetical protein [Armatimonadota bacterium]
MNIFRVLASAKKGFQEEYASAILAWLLNPAMEHGLGYSFLAEFLAEISRAEGARAEMRALAQNLRTSLRQNGRGVASCSTFLELNVATAFIDVVVNIDVGDEHWAIAVENKIFSASASDEAQLTREYEGLVALAGTADTAFTGRRAMMVFLVPAEGGKLDSRVEKEWGDLHVGEKDGRALMTWSVVDGHASLSRAITSLLDKECSGDAQPIHDSVRHTLKALRCFIADKFQGYPYEADLAPSGQNPDTEDRMTYAELQARADGWVGIQHGVGGLLRIMAEPGGLGAYRKPFQYTSKSMATARGWIPLRMFKAIAELDQGTNSNDLTWLDDAKVGPLPASLIYFVATRTAELFYVGIQGGQGTLNGKVADEIDRGRWGVATTKRSAEWIESTTFRRICDGKGISWAQASSATHANTTP